MTSNFNNFKLSVSLDIDSPNKLLITPDNKHLIINGHKIISIIDIDEGKMINHINTDARTFALTPDSKYLVTGGSCISIWDINSGDNILNFANAIEEKEFKGKYYFCKFITHVDISNDGKYIVSCDDGDEYHGKSSEIKVWNILNGNEILSIKILGYKTNSISISPDGKYILNGIDGEKIIRNESDPYKDYEKKYYEIIELYCIKTGKLLNTFEGRIAIFSPDTKTIISASKDGTINIWDLNSGKNIKNLKNHNDKLTSMSISPDGKTIISTSEDGSIKKLDISLGRELKTYHTNEDSQFDFTNISPISPDGKKFAYFANGILKIYDIENENELLSLNKKDLSYIGKIAITLDGQTILCSTTKGLKIIDSTNGKMQRLKTFNGDFNSIAVNYIKDYVISRDTDWDCHSFIRAWDVKTGKVFNIGGDGGGCINSLSIQVSSNGEKVIYGDGTYNSGIINIKSINAKSKLIQSFKGHKCSIKCLAISPSGKYIVSGADNGTIKLWDIETNLELKTFNKLYEYDYLHCLSISLNEKFVISGHGARFGGSSDKAIIIIWDINTEKEFLILKGHKSTIRYILITQDGKRIVSKDDSSTVKIWDINTGKELFSTKLDEIYGNFKTICEIQDTIVQVREKNNIIELFDIVNNKVLMSYAYFDNGEWIIWNSNYEYNCSSNAYKYFSFVEKIENILKAIPENDPIYERMRKIF